MSTRDAEYFRERRRAQGIPGRDPFSARKFLQRAVELRRLEQLPWPTNLFGEPASIAELLAEAAQLQSRPTRTSTMRAGADVVEHIGKCITDAEESLCPRLRCDLFLVGFLQEQVEPRADAEVVQCLLVHCWVIDYRDLASPTEPRHVSSAVRP